MKGNIENGAGGCLRQRVWRPGKKSNEAMGLVVNASARNVAQ